MKTINAKPLNAQRLNSIKTCLAAGLLLSNTVSAAPLFALLYDETNGTQNTQDVINATTFSTHYTNNPPERTPGIYGNALRTDGYSTWMTGPFNLTQANALTFETWIALESYPSTHENNHMPSSLWHQKSGINGFNFGINTYGTWWFTININGQEYSVTAPDSFPLYDWTHLAATIDNGLIKLFVNGQKVAEQFTQTGDAILAPTTDMVIGRSYTPQIDGVFEINAINAAYDETKIHDVAIADSAFVGAYDAGKNTPWQPSLAVPDTRFADDDLKPRYHAMPPANWTNEPHGLVEYNSKFHMFYQRTPNGPYKTMMHWGNMASDNLLVWENLKDAFYPRQNIGAINGLGSKGIWSGDVVVDDFGTAHAFYTTVNYNGDYNPGVAWATSTDAKLENWTLHGGIIDKNDPNPGGIADFRDPYIFRTGNTWHMLVGAGTGSSGAVEYYTSNDITTGNWQRAPHSFSSIPYGQMGIGAGIWEMPVFEFIGKHNGIDKYALVVAPIGGAMNKTVAPYVRSVYWIGTWQENVNGNAGQFIPDFSAPKNLDVIHGHLSPTVVRDNQGKLTSIGIIDERTNSQMQNDLGWAHVFSLPREWRLLEDGLTIGQTPSENLKDLRITSSLVTENNISVANEYKLAASGNQIEMLIEVDANNTADEYGFYISTSADKSELTKIYYDGEDIVIDKTKTTLTAGMEETGIYKDRYDEIAFGKPSKFQVFVDHSAIAVFINDKAVFENRIYPSKADSVDLYLYSNGGTTNFNQVDVYQLGDINAAEHSIIELSFDGEILEEAENEEVITATLQNNQFKSVLDSNQWNFSGLPVGVTIGSITRVSDSQVDITLSGNTTGDYDANIINATLSVNGNQLVNSQLPEVVNAKGIEFTASIEPVTQISLSYDGQITEGNEDGEVITVSLLNNSFDTFNATDWAISNLPAGVGYQITIQNSQTAVITLTGNASDYDVDINDLTVDIDPAAFLYTDPELFGSSVYTSSGVEFSATNGVLNYDFETGYLTNWCVVQGSAFKDEDVSTATHWFAGQFNLHGFYHLWSFFDGGDSDVGEIRTGNFVLEGDGQIQLLISGGRDLSNLYLALVDANTDTELLWATGANRETYEEKVMDASAYIGQSVYLKLVDSSTGGWGHINLDYVRVPVADNLSGQFPSAGPGNPPTSIALNTSSTALTVGESLNLTASVLPTNTCDATVNWISSAPHIVSVNKNGVMTALSAGTATITASTFDGALSDSIVVTSSVSTAPTELVLDFETGDLSGWTTTGLAFSTADISTATTYWGTEQFNHQGTYHMWSFQDGGDSQTGSMRTNDFVLGGDGQVKFKVGGGNNINTLYVALVRSSDSTILYKATGSNIEGYVETVFDATSYIGETLYLQVVDNETGGFGHINIDDVRIPLYVIPQPIVYDFEGADLSDWTITGNAFSIADLATETCYWTECYAFNHHGSQHLWGFKDGGDSQTGTMQSQTFKLSGNGQIPLLISGGDLAEQTYVALVDASSGQELAKVTGNNSEAYQRKIIDGSDYIGQNLYLKVVDNATGGWGHLNIDHILIPVE
ncbi:GH32 C-terminal domain-containing protein [Catenovulum sediminis]|uniref:GH32 C-terminal domain-containing protein n=1 Tax=Catenovulum sediminis TaxID=1740262 RepID=UPI00117E09CD|nr:GH32 C-terminal domain-containing protein [Catenovulum sediminis]